MRTCLMYHAACKVKIQPFKRSYSQLTFFNLKKIFSQLTFCNIFMNYQVILYRSYSQLTFTIRTVVLTADVFQLKKNIFTADVLKYFYELILYRSYSQLTFTIQTVVLTADVFQLEKYQYIFSEEVEKRQL